MKNSLNIDNENPIITNCIMLILALIGLLLLAASIFLGQQYAFLSLLKEFLKELGIVVLSVFSVSLLYEKFIAKKYFSNFIKHLRQQIAQGESNGATCEYLGIREIFKTRNNFESVYSLDVILLNVTETSKFRIVAISMFNLMNKYHLLMDALSKGCQIELAIFDPKSLKGGTEKIQNLEPSDIQSTLNVFKNHIVTWISKSKPTGKIELKFHASQIMDSYSTFKITDKKFGVWDLCFGRDLTRRRVLVIELDKPFGIGIDLEDRYNCIWESGTTVFEYNGSIIKANTLT